jgi:hypothetical protein
MRSVFWSQVLELSFIVGTCAGLHRGHVCSNGGFVDYPKPVTVGKSCFCKKGTTHSDHGGVPFAFNSTIL